MMRSERKTEKWRIPGKWILIFLLILLAFYGYQNILAEYYERQVVPGSDRQKKTERFLPLQNRMKKHIRRAARH